MRIVTYRCDNCYKMLSDRDVAVKHISIVLGNNTGWVSKTKNLIWTHDITVNGVKQFCDEKCLANYFKELKKKCQK